MATTTPTIFQVTAAMVECSTTLTKEDIGLWCFLVKGRYHGFASTRARAALMRKALLE